MPPSFKIDRGTAASVTLYFAGTASPNPGPAGWAATATIKLRDPSTSDICTHKIQTFAPLGHASDNDIPNYLGLIGALRALLNFFRANNIRHAYTDLTVRSHAQLVIEQMNARCPGSASHLAPLHILATGLAANFLQVAFSHCPHTQNARAIRLADSARDSSFSDPSRKAIYYPSLSTLIPVRVYGADALASHDTMTAGSDPSCFIDAGFLRSLPSGDALFAAIRDPAPLSILVGQAHMNVLGTIALELSFSDIYGRHDQLAKVQLVDFTVVDALPVPVHVSFKNPRVRKIKREEVDSSKRIDFDRSNVPVPYRDHRYWGPSNVIFIGHEF